MPLVKPKTSDGGEDGQRASRPPWVRETPPAIPMPSAPWLPKRRESQVKHPPQQPTVNAAPLQSQDSKPEKNVNVVPIQRQDTKPEKNVNVVPIQRQDTKPEKNINIVPIQRQDTKPGKNVNVVPIQGQDTTPEKKVNVVPIQRQDTKPEKNVFPRRQDLKPVPPAQSRQDSKPLPPVINQKLNTKPVTPASSQKQDSKPVTSTPSQKQDSKPIVPITNQKQDVKPKKSDEPRKKVQISEEPNIVMDRPAPPPAPPAPPPPPPPPMASAKPPIDLKPLTESQKAKLDALKSRPRKRPDWTDMMKEVEEGVKLKHIKCNDRSAPVIPKAKAKGQFVYESEKDNAHNLLLKEIHGGIKLKKVKCNDRSKPILDGLRKFRRQMTIEEQIVKKSTSMADVVAMAAQPDELDDIDKVRDDLQSTKQMLAHELRNKETLERENKRLMARLLNLEAELEKEKLSRSIDQNKGEVVQIRTAEDDKLISKLKEEAMEASKMMKQMEDMYKKTAEELDVTRAKLESAWLRNAQMEQDLKIIQNHPDAPPALPRLASSKKLANPSFSTRPILMSSSEEESEEEESEEESESAEEDDGGANTAAQQEKRIARELKLSTAKLKSIKEKKYNAKKEKVALKHQFSNLTKCLNSEKKRYRQLQKEVDKMAKLVKDVEEEEEEEEEDEDEDDLEETESENESEESQESEDSEGDLEESASSQDKISNLTRRLKKSENRLTTLKKCNYLLKANIDRRQDEINKQKEVILSLQEDLNAVLAELG